jgi:hypothetical protein
MSKDPAVAASRIPGFLVQPERRFAGWREAFATLWLRESSEVSDISARFSRNLVETRARLPKRALASSFFLHFILAVFLLRLPLLLPPERELAPRRSDTAVLYYDLGLVHFLKTLPTVKSPGPGGRPGQGNRPDRLPALGSTAFHPKFTIVSNPLRPDNNRQTIIQLSSPPDLRITQELSLPTVLLGNTRAVPKPKLQLHLQAPKNAPVRKEPKAEPPALKVYAVPSDFPVALALPTIEVPHLPVPPPSAMLAAAHTSESANQAASQGAGEQSGDPTAAGGLLVVGVDPSGVAHLLALPPGNRYGAFSISPAGGQPGSPGGVPGGVPGGGTGGAGTGGDGSSGLGPGNSGGGGGGSGAGGSLSISGGSGTDAGVAGNLGTLAYSPSNTAIIPVITTPQLRKNSLLVFTGPIGGGGLGVYGALRGGKIYSMFLHMPGKSWVLQYCFAEKPGTAKPAPESRNVVVQLDQGLVPPEPVERFDFQRVPVPEEKAQKLIVLQGVLRTDGTVGELKLYRGVQADMDQAALAAFGRWKFKPALRANQPVAVDILVGIPAQVPKS